MAYFDFGGEGYGGYGVNEMDSLAPIYGQNYRSSLYQEYQPLFNYTGFGNPMSEGGAYSSPMSGGYAPAMVQAGGAGAAGVEGGAGGLGPGGGYNWMGMLSALGRQGGGQGGGTRFDFSQPPMPLQGGPRLMQAPDYGPTQQIPTNSLGSFVSFLDFLSRLGPMLYGG